jgi:hypothetical protein
MSSQPVDPNPFVGPRPFERQHAGKFYGREREIGDLVSLVTANRFVVLHAASGAGKTSLLNAGLVPLLEEEGFEILPSARVRGLSPSDLPGADIPNIYVLNAILSWTSEEIEPRQLINLSLSELFRVHLTTRTGDGDEENAETIPRVVIIDQFEELFTTYADRWQDREGFFRQLGEALSVDPYLRVILSMREEFVAQMDEFESLIPSGLRTEYRIERLNDERALSAIVRPLADTPYHFDERVAERLVDELRTARVKTEDGRMVAVTGQYIEPVQLQVVCRSLLDRVIASGDTAIMKADLDALGGVTEPLIVFYENALARAEADRTGENVLRRWFEEQLITPAGTRGIVFRGVEETAGIPNTAVDVLENSHLIRGQWRAGARWYELTHDRFIGPVQESNRRRIAERQRQRVRTVLTLAGIVVSFLVIAVLILALRPAPATDEELVVISTAAARVVSTSVAEVATQVEANEELQATSTAQAVDSAQIEATSVAQEATVVAQEATSVAQATQVLELSGLAEVTSNDEWTPEVQEFDGVEIVLAPKGCFTMGDRTGLDGDSSPASEQCFERPFWLDRFEVTNAQYGSSAISAPPEGRAYPLKPNGNTPRAARTVSSIRGATNSGRPL